MSNEPNHTPPFVTHIDVTSHAPGGHSAQGGDAVVVSLLQEILKAQDRQNELMEELIQQINVAQRQRANELGQWKQANPRLARHCREAAEALSHVQSEFLRGLTEEVRENAEDLAEGEFMLNEFVDRYGPRLAHLNGVLQVLSQLSSASESHD